MKVELDLAKKMHNIIVQTQRTDCKNFFEAPRGLCEPVIELIKSLNIEELVEVQNNLLDSIPNPILDVLVPICFYRAFGEKKMFEYFSLLGEAKAFRLKAKILEAADWKTNDKNRSLFRQFAKDCINFLLTSDQTKSESLRSSFSALYTPGYGYQFSVLALLDFEFDLKILNFFNIKEPKNDGEKYFQELIIKELVTKKLDDYKLTSKHYATGSGTFGGIH